MRPRRAEFDWLRREPLRTLLAILNGDGIETRVVGGAVRDALIGREIGDVDLATTGLPEEIARRATLAGFRPVPTGLEHGTVTVVADGRAFEVTTLRHDVETDGRRAVVRFGNDWEEDARRRDFTMNALYVEADGTIQDPLGGCEDALAGRVRFIGEAERRIAEDHLRILRFFRFHAGYGQGDPQPADLAACVRLRLTLLRLSAERVRQEMLRLLVPPRAAAALRVMSETGILQIVIGGVDRLPAFERLARLEETLDEAAEPVRRLGALAVIVEEDASRLFDRLRLSKVESRRLLAMAEARPRLKSPADEAPAKEVLYRNGPELYADIVRHAAASEARDADALAGWHDLVRLPQRWTAPAFPLNGGDVAALGARGREIGQTLKALEAAWIAGGFSGGREHWLARAAELLPRG
ncbi:CCA tRNA nucleotidyltransferase [Lutibaculum baratangense]|uniref:tRNA nucleotidyltransferase n=1 Tax=Lutibaculum baratangense AMV1 TaxID=631454 RepID=V4T9F9_9HYPH|nr:CCA tRNA nucleotidyltransferase [Lutibaculum baratangense]ESR23163.1 tRNA nucleotidyltransferase [Lutibaculum baratangense AMV1]